MAPDSQVRHIEHYEISRINRRLRIWALGASSPRDGEHGAAKADQLPGRFRAAPPSSRFLAAAQVMANTRPRLSGCPEPFYKPRGRASPSCNQDPFAPKNMDTLTLYSDGVVALEIGRSSLQGVTGTIFWGGADVRCRTGRCASSRGRSAD